MKQYAFFAENDNFTTFGFQHLVMISLTIVLSIALPLVAKRFMTEQQQLLINRIMIVIIFGWTMLYIFIKIGLGDFDYKDTLPLDICNVIALLLPLFMWTPDFKAHQILYYWILAGTLQGVLTPHLDNGFPNYTFFKFWVLHAGLVIYTIYITVVFGFFPTLKGIWHAFLALQVYIVFILIVNYILKSNYFYILEKPPSPNLLDYFPPWPWYILVCNALISGLFFLLYLPFLFIGKS